MVHKLGLLHVPNLVRRIAMGALNNITNLYAKRLMWRALRTAAHFVQFFIKIKLFVTIGI